MNILWEARSVSRDPERFTKIGDDYFVPGAMGRHAPRLAPLLRGERDGLVGDVLTRLTT
jgi:hypothetical protein